MSRLTPTKAASTGFVPMGLYRGTVVDVRDNLVDVQVPRLSGTYVYRDIEVLSSGLLPMLEVGASVYVTFVEGYHDAIIVVGPVRQPSRWITGELESSSGYVDPLEEYPFTREGTVTVGSSYRWPIRRSAQLTELVATLVSPSTTGNVVVQLLASGVVLGTITIAEGTTSASTPILGSITAGEMLTFNVTEAGTAATTLFVAARGRSAITGYVDEYAFGFGGSIVAGQSHIYPARRKIDITEVHATLTAGGVGTLSFNVLVNDEVVETIEIVEGTTSVIAPVNFSLNVGDDLSVVVTAASTGTVNLGVFVRGQL